MIDKEVEPGPTRDEKTYLRWICSTEVEKKDLLNT